MLLVVFYHQIKALIILPSLKSSLLSQSTTVTRKAAQYLMEFHLLYTREV